MLLRLKNNFFDRLDVRLTIYYTLILLFLFVLFSSFFLYRLHHSFIKQIDYVLHDEALELIQEIKTEGDFFHACSIFEEDTAKRKHYPIYFRVMDMSEAALYTSSTAISKKHFKNLLFPPVTPEEKHYYSFKVPGRSPFRCYQKKIRLNGADTYILQLITPTSRTNKIYNNMFTNILRTMPVVFVLSIAFGLFASRKPFEIIRKMNKITKRITSSNLSERLPVPSTKSEVKDLTETINSMLYRLEKSFEEVMQFTSDVAHELRNPIFAIQGEMELMLSAERTIQEYRKATSICLERINGLAKITSDLFLISRFDSKKVSMEITSVNLSGLLRDLYSFFLPIAQEKHIDFTIQRCDEIVAHTDKTRLQQLMSNLIDNAIKFTPDGNSVVLSLQKQNNTVDFRVKDSGTGIPADEMQNIFKRFYQVDNSRSGSDRGSGLGLQICKRITEALGGSIRVEQNAEKGVTFIFTLPARK